MSACVCHLNHLAESKYIKVLYDPSLLLCTWNHVAALFSSFFHWSHPNSVKNMDWWWLAEPPKNEGGCFGRLQILLCLRGISNSSTTLGWNSEVDWDGASAAFLDWGEALTRYCKWQWYNDGNSRIIVLCFHFEDWHTVIDIRINIPINMTWIIRYILLLFCVFWCQAFGSRATGDAKSRSSGFGRLKCHGCHCGIQIYSAAANKEHLRQTETLIAKYWIKAGSIKISIKIGIDWTHLVFYWLKNIQNRCFCRCFVVDFQLFSIVFHGWKRLTPWFPWCLRLWGEWWWLEAASRVQGWSEGSRGDAACGMLSLWKS